MQVDDNGKSTLVFRKTVEVKDTVVEAFVYHQEGSNRDYLSSPWARE